MQEAQAVADKLDDALGILSLECRKTLLPTPRIVVRAAYLLEPANVGPFRAAFDALRAPRSELRWLLTGPWPPYNFVRRPDPDDPPGRQRLADFARLLTDAMEERRG